MYNDTFKVHSKAMSPGKSLKRIRKDGLRKAMSPGKSLMD